MTGIVGSATELYKVTAATGDAKHVFKSLQSLSPDFNMFVNEFYDSFKDDIDLNTLDKYGKIFLKTRTELDKLAIRLEADANDYELITANAIILVYGYAEIFNQAMDIGIISKYLDKRIRAISNAHDTDPIYLLQQLDDMSAYKSVAMKRYDSARALLNDKALVAKLKDIWAIDNIFDDSYMQINDAKLHSALLESGLTKNNLLSNYLNLFKINYFPSLMAIRLLLQTKKTGGHHKMKTKVAANKRLKGADLDALERLYTRIKMWKDISGLEINNCHLKLYFDILDVFSTNKKIPLYSPIKLFVDKINVLPRAYKKYYNISGA